MALLECKILFKNDHHALLEGGHGRSLELVAESMVHGTSAMRVDEVVCIVWIQCKHHTRPARIRDKFSRGEVDHGANGHVPFSILRHDLWGTGKRGGHARQPTEMHSIGSHKRLA
jgi:hypothetical protein